MAKKSGRSLVMVGFQLEPTTHAELKRWAELKKMPISEACRVLIRSALGAPPSLGAGYNDGLRRGLHEARTAFSAALKKAWRSE